MRPVSIFESKKPIRLQQNNELPGQINSAFADSAGTAENKASNGRMLQVGRLSTQIAEELPQNKAAFTRVNEPLLEENLVRINFTND